MVIDVVRRHWRLGRYGEGRESATGVGALRISLVEGRVRARGGGSARAAVLGGGQAMLSSTVKEMLMSLEERGGGMECLSMSAHLQGFGRRGGRGA